MKTRRTDLPVEFSATVLNIVKIVSEQWFLQMLVNGGDGLCRITAEVFVFNQK